MGNAKVIFGNETLIDLTGDTVSANNLLSGATAHDRSGTAIQGAVTVPSALDDLTDVDITTPTGGQVLTYDSASQKWVNANGGGGGGFVLADWLTAGGLNPMSYADLTAVLADEKAVRKLMTIHTAVDYLAGQTAVDASINTILTDNTCAKWINLRDYALDTLYDNALFASIMDASGKYFLGEWAKLSTSPETWGPKGNVPIMTGTSAPYGEVICSSQDQTDYAWKVFDGNDSTNWTGNTGTNQRVGYKFTNPVCIKRVSFKPTNGNRVKNFKIQASNDGSTWTDLYTGVHTDGQAESVCEITNNAYYLYYCLFVIDNVSGWVKVNTLQFYGREMKVSVPVMTSNTAPYGEVTYSSQLNNANYYGYRAFDTTEKGWCPLNNASSTEYVRYTFDHTIKLGFAKLSKIGDIHTQDVVIQGSENGVDFDDLQTISFEACAASTTSDILTKTAQLSSVGKCFGIKSTGFYNANTYGWKVQFYGFDYSEYDWDADNPRHYLYDHGVEPNEAFSISKTAGKTDLVADERLGSELYIYKNSASSAVYHYATTKVDFTSYNLMRAVGGMYGYGDSNVFGICITTADMPPIYGSALVTNLTLKATAPTDYPNNMAIDMSSVSTSYTVAFGAVSNAQTERYCSISEWWLE